MGIDPETMEVYRTTARTRRAAREAEQAAARDRAWLAAVDAAAMLRSQFGAGRVVAFGSLVEAGGRYFGLRSDIDMAAWGIRDQDYFLAVGRLQALSAEFSFDLVAMQRCPDYLRPAIEREGCEL